MSSKHFSLLTRDVTGTCVLWPLEHSNTEFLQDHWVRLLLLIVKASEAQRDEVTWQGHQEELGLESSLLGLSKMKCIGGQDVVTGGIWVKHDSSRAYRFGVVPPEGTSGFWDRGKRRRAAL